MKINTHHSSSSPIKSMQKWAVTTVLFAGCMGVSAPAFAQSTPTELADLSLESLLDFDVGDHVEDGDNKKKKWRFETSYHRLNIGGYRMGTTDFSFDQVLFSPGETRTALNYPVVPTDITQEVYGFSGSYALTDELDLSVLVPYITQATDHISSVPGFANFVLTSKGIGDIALNVSHTRKVGEISALKLSAGVRIPVGSIDITGDTPRNGSGTLERLPYTMQLGSGTLDAAFSANYVRTDNALTCAISASSVVRTGMNDNDYRLGNNVRLSLSGQYAVNQWFQPGARVSVRHIGKIKGRDNSLLVPSPLFPFPAPITDPSQYGGEKAGVAFSVKSCLDAKCNVNLTAEYGIPIYQHLNGVQPKEKNNFSLGVAVKF